MNCTDVVFMSNGDMHSVIATLTDGRKLVGTGAGGPAEAVTDLVNQVLNHHKPKTNLCREPIAPKPRGR